MATALTTIACPAVAAGKPQIWFCPKWTSPTGSGGCPDYMDLFKPGSPWQAAASHVDLFKTYNPERKTGAELVTEFADLKRRHITLAMEFGALTAKPGRGQGVEGQGGQAMLRVARLVRNHGGDLKVIAFDEPIFFGTIYSGKNAFALSVDEMAKNLAANVKELWTEFPNVQVGDIEPLATTGASGMSHEQVVMRYAEGIEAINRELGRPLAFFHADLDWNDRDYLSYLRETKSMVNAHHIPFGVIYNGQGENGNDEWMQAARVRMAKCEAAVGTPDMVIFQSWNPYPQKVLPETDRAAFTSILNNYFETPTKLTAAYSGSALTGRLVTSKGAGVPNARIAVNIAPQFSNGEQATYTYRGDIPTGAQKALIGIRVNTEGAGPGACDVRITDLSLEMPDERPAIWRFAQPPDLASWPQLQSGNKSAIIENEELHIAMNPGKELVLNSEAVPIPSTGTCTLTVRASIPSASAHSGYFGLIFLGEKGEVGRAKIDFDVPNKDLMPVTTDRSGHWRVFLPNGSCKVRCNYGGDEKHWPAETSITTR